jgi:hypothetical protein
LYQEYGREQIIKGQFKEFFGAYSFIDEPPIRVPDLGLVCPVNGYEQ